MEPDPLTAGRVGLQEESSASGRQAGNHVSEDACAVRMPAVRRVAPSAPDIRASRLSG
jgi:hypothetical protein